jgi:integrase
MGRRRTKDFDLPPHMHRKGDRFYYGRNQIALGSNFRDALLKYAELHTGAPATGTFADAVRCYLRDEIKHRSTKTQAEYSRQVVTLVKVFGHMPLDTIRPKDVADYMRARGEKTIDKDSRAHGGPIVATREKALLSAIYSFARSAGLVDAPNPCAGIRGTKSKRDRYVTDAELSDVVARADATLGAFLELCYYTGQRPGDVVRMRRQDVQDGALIVRQGKTGAKVRIAVVGPLEGVIERLTTGAVASMFLVRDAHGQPLTLPALRKRFDNLGVDWQIRDLRAKAASDSDSSREAQRLLGHAAASTTDVYIRQRAGERANPIMRGIAEAPRIAEKPKGGSR